MVCRAEVSGTVCSEAGACDCLTSSAAPDSMTGTAECAGAAGVESLGDGPEAARVNTCGLFGASGPSDGGSSTIGSGVGSATTSGGSVFSGTGSGTTTGAGAGAGGCGSANVRTHGSRVTFPNMPRPRTLPTTVNEPPTAGTSLLL